MKFYEFNTSSDKVSADHSWSLGLLNAEHKPSAKKRSTGPVSDRSTGLNFEFYWWGRVEKILIGSISVTDNNPIFAEWLSLCDHSDCFLVLR